MARSWTAAPRSPKSAGCATTHSCCTRKRTPALRLLRDLGRVDRVDADALGAQRGGAGGVERSEEHARASADLATAMNPRFLSALTLTVVPGTPIARAEEKGHFTMPDTPTTLRELRTFVAHASPSDAIFRTNHASNRLPIAGRLPRDRDDIVKAIDGALDGEVPLRPEWLRGL